MTAISMALKRLLDKAGSEEFLRTALENILQLLMDTDVSGQIKAARHEGRLNVTITGTAFASVGLIPVSGNCICIFPSCDTVHIFLNSWSRGV